MAYISPQQVALMRKIIKSKYPELKLSICRVHGTTISVKILQGPYDWTNITRFYRRSKNESIERVDILYDIDQIINNGNHNKSDLMTDYFDVGWFTDLEIGSWDKPYIQTKL